MHQDEKLVAMVNQIGHFFAHQGPERAPQSIADHMRKFWDPRMRAAIKDHLAKGGAGLDAFAIKAVELL